MVQWAAERRLCCQWMAHRAACVFFFFFFCFLGFFSNAVTLVLFKEKISWMVFSANKPHGNE